MTNKHASSPRSSKLLAYLRLFRLPNVFTAAADATMGFLFVQRSLEPLGAYLCLLGASCLLYTGGMVLNDVYDVDLDAKQRPERPLPSGQISRAWASRLGYSMLTAGAALAWLAPYAGGGAAAFAWRSGAVALVLACCVVVYDALLKRTFLGPLGMGACRLLNVLLGMSAASLINPASRAPNIGDWPLGYDTAQLTIAGGIGLYIVGVTWFARREAQQSGPIPLTLALVMMLGGIVLLGSLARRPVEWDGGLQPEVYWLLLAMIAFTVARRCFSAVLKPTPDRVQSAVKHCILTLIVLDASVCLSIKILGNPAYALGVLALLIPTLLLGRWVYST